MPWYYCVRFAIDDPAPLLLPTQKTNLALLMSVVLKKRTLCLSELAQAILHPPSGAGPPPSRAYSTA